MRRMISAGATASVGDTIAPSTKAGPQASPTTSWADDGDRGHGHPHERDREQRDRLRVPAQVAHGGEEGGTVEERREEDQQDEVRVELDVRHARQEADHRAARHERHGVRDPDQPGEDREGGDGHQEPEDDQLDVGPRDKGGSIRGVLSGHALREARLPPVRRRPGGGRARPGGASV